MHDAEQSLKHLGSTAFWHELMPVLHITDTPFENQHIGHELSPELQTRLRKQMIDDGYFQLPPILDEEETLLLRNLVLQLHQENIMPIFAAVYDEFWQTLQRLRGLLTPVLGAGYRLVPDFWVWHVEADDNVAGWGPHRDGDQVATNMRSDGTPTLCTAWITLTDVDTTNSCIYLLPRKYDAVFQDFVRRKFGQPGIPNPEQIPLPLNRVRALPARAGSILGWDQNMLHWGSGSSQWAAGPRISVGIYYLAADAPLAGRPFDDTHRIHIEYEDPTCRLTLKDRLTIIANDMDTYANKLERDKVHEPHYGPTFRAFRERWKWPANNGPQR